MEKMIVMGGKPLNGEVTISGAKNSAVAVIPAALLVDGVCRIENVPNINDVTVLLNILASLGAKHRYVSSDVIDIDCTNLKTHVVPYEMAVKMRASSYLIGSLIGRFNKAEVAMPGGCNFGVRPIDQHLKGFVALGADVKLEHGVVNAVAEKLIASSIYLDVVSVGATINIMLAASKAEGVTHIENASKEPHVVDVANFLNAMGANIKGAGTDVIKITGVRSLHGGTYSIIPDQIEAGTFMLAAAATKGNCLIKNVIPKHLEAITSKLIEMGVQVEEFEDSVRVSRTGELKATNIKTLPYPGYPTDLQPQTVALLSIAKGVSVITESVWDNRFQYIDEVRRMGADIKVDGRSAIIQGVHELMGAPVKMTDLRAGAALIIAGLAANGVTELANLVHIDRGYENLEQKLQALGAQIVRKVCDDAPEFPDVKKHA
ncbi:MAG: UDP-N-acetylglucosamine 1-carboxyvinyltransferase [Clostridiales bacterium]|jgi:UDP-N-acetylglucosamine 1-carboxyvinyltransferase|nr:UDP-N-acetylglucosamine 1-carboxyvinyltransferase [Clostridiales bacterium]